MFIYSTLRIKLANGSSCDKRIILFINALPESSIALDLPTVHTI